MSIGTVAFWPFWSSLFLQPRTFFRTYLAGAGGRLPYFWLAILVYGTGYGIERADKQLNKAYASHHPERVAWLNNWPIYWIVVVVAGLIGGYITFLIASWFYHVRLQWSGASRDMDRARALYLYSSVVASVAFVTYALLALILQPRPYSGDDVSTAGGVGALLVYSCLFYSVYVSYCGVITTTDAEPEKARLWLLILPMLLYGLAIVALVTFLAFF